MSNHFCYHFYRISFCSFFFLFFFFNDTPTTEIYTLSLHDALPIFVAAHQLEDDVVLAFDRCVGSERAQLDRKSTRLNSSHVEISYAAFCLKKKKTKIEGTYDTQAVKQRRYNIHEHRLVM